MRGALQAHPRASLAYMAHALGSNHRASIPTRFTRGHLLRLQGPQPLDRQLLKLGACSHLLWEAWRPLIRLGPATLLRSLTTVGYKYLLTCGPLGTGVWSPPSQHRAWPENRIRDLPAQWVHNSRRETHGGVRDGAECGPI